MVSGSQDQLRGMWKVPIYSISIPTKYWKSATFGAIRRVWRRPRNHHNDFYFCMIDVTNWRTKSKMSSSASTNIIMVQIFGFVAVCIYISLCRQEIQWIFYLKCHQVSIRRIGGILRTKNDFEALISKLELTAWLMWELNLTKSRTKPLLRIFP